MKNLLTAVLVIAATALNAQVETIRFTEPEQPFKRFTFCDVSLTSGWFEENRLNNSREDIEHLLGHSNTELADTATSFDKGFYDYGVTASAFFKINSNKPKLYHHVGAMLTYSGYHSFGYSNGETVYTNIDTLTSNNNPYYVIVDTFTSRSKSGYLNAQNLYLTLSYRISTNPARKFSVFATGNLSLGGSVKSTYTYSSWESHGRRVSPLLDTTGLTNPNNGMHYYQYSNYDFSMPDFSYEKAPGVFVVRPFVSAGISYRLSKKIKVLRNMSYYLEGKYGAQMMFTGGRMYGSGAWGFTAGLRYNIVALPNPKG